MKFFLFFLYFVYFLFPSIFALRSTSTVPLVGIDGAPYSGDNIPATSAMLNIINAVWRNTLGELFIADTYNQRVRKVSTSGIISTFIGTGAGDNVGTANFNGDNLALTATNLILPCGVFQNSLGDVYIADTYNSIIRRVINGATTNSVFAGIGGTRAAGSNNVQATSTCIGLPYSVWGDTSGVIYIPDATAHVILKVSTSGIMTTIVGTTGSSGYGTNGQAGTSTAIYGPFNLWGDNVNTLYFTELYNNVVRKVTLSTGIVNLVVGVNGNTVYAGENTAGTSTPLTTPAGIFGDTANNLYIADDFRIRKYIAATQTTVTLLGNSVNGATADGSVASTAYSINIGRGLFADSNAILFCDAANHQVRSIQLSTSIVTVVAGTESLVYGWNGNNLPGTSAKLYRPLGLSADLNSTHIFINDYFNNRVRRLHIATNIISDFAGNGVQSYTSDNVPATSTSLYYPTATSQNTLGEVYIADCYNHRVRKVDLHGIITTIAGSAAVGFSGDNGPATAAALNYPEVVVVDRKWGIFFTEFSTCIIRKVDWNGIISTIVGTPGVTTSSADGLANAISITNPIGLWIDHDHKYMYFAEYGAAKIRKMHFFTKVVTTIAGNGIVSSPTGDNTPGLTTTLNLPRYLVGDTCSNIYYSDSASHKIRMIDYLSGTVTTVAGTGTVGYSTGTSSATSENMNNPTGVWIDANNTIYFCDTGNYRLRRFQVIGATSCIDFPTSQPSQQPTIQPSAQPTIQPSSQPTSQPTGQPSRQPTSQPSRQPSSQPTTQPSSRPSSQPTSQPSRQPTDQPTAQPTVQPTVQPSSRPSSQPTNQPSSQPTSQPTSQPSKQPTTQPSEQPTTQPTVQPSSRPTSQPTSQPSRQPTGQPTAQPSIQPSSRPSSQPTNQPSSQPSGQPTAQPSTQPSSQPSRQPSSQPSAQPTVQPTVQPTSQPSCQPVGNPTGQPTNQPSGQPSGQPTSQPSRQPTAQPTIQPSSRPSSQPTSQPSTQPTSQPSSKPSSQPTSQPSSQPTGQPSGQPSRQPSDQPNSQPSTQPSSQPSSQPTGQPTGQPTAQPSIQPSSRPSSQPTNQPSSQPTGQPTAQPSTQPSSQPSRQPSSQPSAQPTVQPTVQPTSQPVGNPTSQPTNQPTRQPTSQPSRQPTSQPSRQPTAQPTTQPSSRPSSQPTTQPSRQPTSQPSSQPSVEPTNQPTKQPTGQPSSRPTSRPSSQPSRQPSVQPTRQPTSRPSSQPSRQPSRQPTSQPSAHPSSQPSFFPTTQPSSRPSIVPTSQPSRRPSSTPSVLPSSEPSSQPSSQPSNRPSWQPSSNPTSHPTIQPTCQPSSEPTSQPSMQPTVQPSADPTSQPSNYPTAQPSLLPTSQPTCNPTGQPSAIPTRQPSMQPSAKPSSQPSTHPSSSPTSQPSFQPTLQPSGQPTKQPVISPTSQPSSSPTSQPSVQPSRQPYAKPSGQPSSHPSPKPSPLFNKIPTVLPTVAAAIGSISINLVEGDPWYVNPEVPFKLAATIKSSVPCDAHWTGYAESQQQEAMNLTALATCPLYASVGANRVTTSYLILDSNTMKPEQLYAFHISCGNMMTTFIQIRTNQGPLWGTMNVSPKNGQELLTPFVMEATGWIDDDLPLTYLFAYVSPSSGSNMLISEKLLMPQLQSMLPAGFNSNNYLLVVLVMVHDRYEAMSSESMNVFVKPIENTEQLKQVVDAQLAIPITAANVVGMSQFVSVASGTIARNNCSDVPNCGEMNRENCSSIVNTCGRCKQGYIGAMGSQNTPCISDSDTALLVAMQQKYKTSNTSAIQPTTPCHKNEDCIHSWEYCNSRLHRCEERSQICPNNCSDHGQCIYTNVDTGMVMTNCTLFDVGCEATCLCHEGFGGDACEWTASEITIKQSLSRTLLKSLHTISKYQNVTPVTIMNTVANLHSLSQSASYLEEEGILMVQRIALIAIQNTLSTPEVKYTDIQDILPVMDVAVQAKVNNQLSNLLAKKQVTSAANASLTDSSLSTLVPLNKALTIFCQIVSRDSVPGQKIVSFVGNNFRLSSQQVSVTNARNISLSIPLTPLEQLVDTSSSSLQVVDTMKQGLVGNSSTISMQMIEMKAALLFTGTTEHMSNRSHENSNIVTVRVEGIKEVVIAVRNIKPFNLSSIPYLMENITTYCKGKNDNHTEEMVCSQSGLILSNECRKKREVMVKYCPPLKTICNLLNMTTGGSMANHSACNMQAYTPSYTYCKCKVQAMFSDSLVGGNRRNRKLSDTTEVLKATGLLTIASVAVYELNDVETTFAAAPALTSPQALEKSLTVILLFATLWAGGLGLLLGSSWMKYANDQQRKKVTPNLENAGKELKKDSINPQKQSQSHGDVLSSVRISDQITEYIQSMFPSAFRDTPWLSKVAEEMWKNHRYIALFVGNQSLSKNGDMQRILAGVRLLSVQSLLMFLLALLYDLQAPDDDGSCLQFVNQEKCLAKRSFFDANQAYCAWIENTDDGFSCQYAAPEVTLKTSLYIAVMVSCCSSVCGRPLDWLFDLLTAPTADSIKATLAEQAVMQRIGRRMSNVAIGAGHAARRMSVAAVQTATAAVQKMAGGGASEKKKEMIAKAGATIRTIPEDITEAQQKARSSMVGMAVSMQSLLRTKEIHRQSVRQSMMTAASSTAIALPVTSSTVLSMGKEEHIRAPLSLLSPRVNSVVPVLMDGAYSSHELSLRFQEEIFQQYHMLQGAEKIEFARQWGLSDNNHFLSISHNQTVFHLLEKELLSTKKESQQKIQKLQIATDMHIGMEILHCFILDILGKHTPAARIYRSKADAEYHHTIIVTRAVKGLVICILILMNFFFVYYAMLKGFVKGSTWQYDYAMACIVQMSCEICLFETLETFWMDFLIPSFAAKEVQEACHLLIEVVHRLCQESDNYEKRILTAGRRFPLQHTHTKKITTTSSQEDLYFLNTADYFFVSNHIARAYPNILESMIVSSYVSPFPGHMQWKWHKHFNRQEEPSSSTAATSATSTEERALRSRHILLLMDILYGTHGENGWNQWFRHVFAFTTGLFVLQNMAAFFPYELQRMFIRFVQPFFLGGLLLLWQAIAKNTWSIVLFAFLVTITVIYLGYQYVKAWKEESRGNSTIHPGIVDEINEEAPDEVILEEEEEEEEKGGTNSSDSDSSHEGSDGGKESDVEMHQSVQQSVQQSDQQSIQERNNHEDVTSWSITSSMMHDLMEEDEEEQKVHDVYEGALSNREKNSALFITQEESSECFTISSATSITLRSMDDILPSSDTHALAIPSANV